MASHCWANVGKICRPCNQQPMSARRWNAIWDYVGHMNQSVEVTWERMCVLAYKDFVLKVIGNRQVPTLQLQVRTQDLNSRSTVCQPLHYLTVPMDLKARLQRWKFSDLMINLFSTGQLAEMLYKTSPKEVSDC